MKNLLENKVAALTVLVLFAIAVALNSYIGAAATAPARGLALADPENELVAHGPSLPPDPWESIRVAHGPSLPPDPWESIRVAHGPSLPPDPWESIQLV